MEGWFAHNGLPYTESLSEALERWGVSCVEHIKLLPRDDFMDIFKDDKVGNAGSNFTLCLHRLIIFYSIASK